jgi:hypothetical protein
MITLDINNEQIQRAENLYPFGALNGSITNGRSNIYGALGEVVVMDYYSHLDVDADSTYDYDMIIDGHKVDVNHTLLCSIRLLNRCYVPLREHLPVPRGDLFVSTHPVQ